MKTTLLIGLALVAGLVPAACGTDDPQLGERFATPNTEVVVHRADFTDSHRYELSGAAQVADAPEGSVYLVVEASVKNSGTAKRFGGGDDFRATAADGVQRDPLKLGDDGALGFKQLFLGEELRGELVFELPAATAVANLTYAPPGELPAATWRLERGG